MSLSLPLDNSIEVKRPFDKFEFQYVVKDSVADDVFQDLQERFGSNIAGAVDYYETEHKKRNKDTELKVNQENGQGEQSEQSVDHAGRRMLCYRDQFHDKITGRWTFKHAAKRSGKLSKFRHYVLVVRRVHSAENRVFSHSVVEVRGNYLRGVLCMMFRGSGGFPLSEAATELKEDSVHFLYWARPELSLLERHFSGQRDPTPDNSQAHFEIRAALQFIDEEWGYMTQILESPTSRTISFGYLWAIFPPDSLIINSDSLDNKRIYRIRQHSVERTKEGTFFVLALEFADFNHSQLGSVTTVSTIPAYDGFVAVEDLPAVPLKFFSNHKTLISDILKRTSRQLQFYEDKTPKVQQHIRPDNSGIGLVQVEDKLQRFNFRGRLVIDIETLSRDKPESKLLHKFSALRSEYGTRFSDLDDPLKAEARDRVLQLLLENEQRWNSDPDSSPISAISESSSVIFTDVKGTGFRGSRAVNKLTLEQKLLFSGCVYGYSLGDEAWGAFPVDRIADIKWDDDVLDSLVMEADMKDTLFGLIETHVLDSSGFDDFVKGKGKGLIGLLSGPPGAGKTLTAEAIAEKAHMPLYMVSSSSLGSSATSVNESLSRVLRLANHWKAVLLLDEADVFLARRSLDDLERNAIVSVFLREVEYYPGILLLTTNLPDLLDEAFESRIHFFHHYVKLDEAGREAVWRNFARAVTGIKVLIDDEGYKKVRQLDLNGRQIKNVMSISVKLAMFKHDSVLGAERIIATAKTLQKNRGRVCHPPDRKPKADKKLTTAPTPKPKPSRFTSSGQCNTDAADEGENREILGDGKPSRGHTNIKIDPTVR